MRYLMLVMLCLAGCCCCTPPKVEPATVAAPATMPSYDELVATHNSRVKDIERFWARAVIEIRWTDANGKSRFEQGDGHLILDLPNRSYLSIGKLGQTKLWAGSNDTHFWLFDELDGKKLYLGRHDGKSDPGLTGIKHRSPLPIRPVDMPRLLGILPITAGPTNPASPVTWDLIRREQDRSLTYGYRIEPAGERTRYYFHPVSSRVLRVDMLDERGQVVLTSQLSQPERIEAEKAAVGPYLNKRIEVVTAGQEGNMVLYLSDMTDAEQKVNPDAFNLDVLKEQQQPDVIIPIESR